MLTPEGLQDWRGGVTPSSHITKIGLSVTTGRYSERLAGWSAKVVTEIITHTFPKLSLIGLNLEFSYECHADHEAVIMNLLRNFRNVGIRIVGFFINSTPFR